MKINQFKTDKKYNNDAISEELATYNAKSKLKKEQKLLEDKNRKVVLNCVLNATKRMAKEQGIEDLINFYGNNKYEEYFANFVRQIKGKKNLSTKEAIEILNDDLIKNVNGSFFDATKKMNNIQNAYIIFKNAVASAEIELAREYGESNYYEMEKSQNQQAVKAFEEFESWQKDKDKFFKDALQLDNDFMQIRTSNNPMNELSKDGLVAIGLSISMASVISLIGGKQLWKIRKRDANKLAYMERNYLNYKENEIKRAKKAFIRDDVLNCIMVGLPIGLGLLFDNLYAKDTEYMDAIEKIAKNYGFDDVSTMFNALRGSVYAYLTPEEANALSEVVSMQAKEVYAKNMGYENLADAMADIDAHSSSKVLSSSEILKDISNERVVANEFFAKDSGFTSYSELLTYLNNHKILTGETEFRHIGFGGAGAGWSVYDYDLPNARIVADKLTLLDMHYDEMVANVKSNGLYQEYTVYDDAEIKQLAMQLNAYDNATTSIYEAIENSKDNVFYSNDELLYYAGNEALDLSQKNGFEEITDKKYNDWTLILGDKNIQTVENLHNGSDFVSGNGVGSFANNIADDVPDVADELADSAIDATACGGLVVGAGISVLLKYNKQISSAVKQIILNKKNDKLAQIDKQVKEDNKRGK